MEPEKAKYFGGVCAVFTAKFLAHLWSQKRLSILMVYVLFLQPSS
jgi:hypothetical protein